MFIKQWLARDENWDVTTAGDITCYYSHYVMFVEWPGSVWISSGVAYVWRCLCSPMTFQHWRPRLC